MDRRFAARMREAMEDAIVDPQVFRDVQPRLEEFLKPFVAGLREAEQQVHARNYVTGLLSDLKRKNVEAVAYLHDQERLPLQKFIGCSPWDPQPLLGELARQVGAELGEADGVIVFDPSAHAKKGNASVGVQRQWCGRLGKVDNCQVGVYMGYVSRLEQALVDVRLYLPQSWASDKKRRKQAGVPKDVRFQTRHELALAMLDEHGPSLPHAWITGDDEMGRSSSFRQKLRDRNERYLLMVPSNTLVRDLEAEPPPYGGRGPRPQTPFVRVDRWVAAQPATAWTTVEIRPGEKGPLIVETMKRRVAAKTDRRRAGPEEVLLVFREKQADGTFKHDYALAFASAATPLPEFARVFNAEHRVEQCLQRAKGEAGLSDYQVRTWRGWHHHQTLSLIATWFLTQEARRGKNQDTRANGATTPLVYCGHSAPSLGLRPNGLHLPHRHAPPATQPASAALLLALEETTQPCTTVTG
jgi:SRSO17 transposase